MSLDEIGQSLRRLRVEQQLTLTAVAERAGVSAATLSRIETNKQNLDVGLLCRLAEVLGVEAAEVLSANGSSDDPRALARRLSRRASERMKVALESPKGRSRRQIEASMDEIVSTVEILRDELLAMQRKLRQKAKR